MFYRDVLNMFIKIYVNDIQYTNTTYGMKVSYLGQGIGHRGDNKTTSSCYR